MFLFFSNAGRLGFDEKSLYLRKISLAMTEYYIINSEGNQVGPISEILFPNYGVTPSTLVWCEGMPEWRQASQVPQLRHLFGNATPPPPPPRQAPEPPRYERPRNEGYRAERVDNAPAEPCPPTYLAWSIVVTILCCIFTGVPAIVYACQVSSKYSQGDYAGARRASEQAKIWIIVSVVLGFVCGIFSFTSSFFSALFGL